MCIIQHKEGRLFMQLGVIFIDRGGFIFGLDTHIRRHVEEAVDKGPPWASEVVPAA